MGRRCSRKTALKSTRVDRPSAVDGAPERDLVREFEVTAVRDAASDTADGDAARRELARQEQGRGFAVDGWRCGDDHLAHALFGQELEQALERQLVGADAVERREQP